MRLQILFRKIQFKLLIKYPNIDINVNYVYPIDDKADGHFDIYKHDFWDYPWPQALGKFLTSSSLDFGCILQLVEFSRQMVALGWPIFVSNIIHQPRIALDKAISILNR